MHAVGQAAYCLVLDLDMPGRPRSVPLLAEVKGVAHDIRMAVYTGHAHSCLALATLKAGAAAYVSKASGRRLALDAIRTVVDGGRFVDPSIDLEVASNHAWRCLTASERRECRAQVADGRPWPRSSVELRARAGTAESW